MSFRDSFLVAFLAILLQMLIMPWLPVFGVVIPAGFLLIGFALYKLNTNGVILALAVGGFLVDIWSAVEPVSLLLGFYAVALFVWLSSLFEGLDWMRKSLTAPLVMVVIFELATAPWASTGLGVWLHHLVLLCGLSLVAAKAMHSSVNLARRVI